MNVYHFSSCTTIHTHAYHTCIFISHVRISGSLFHVHFLLNSQESDFFASFSQEPAGTQRGYQYPGLARVLVSGVSEGISIRGTRVSNPRYEGIKSGVRGVCGVGKKRDVMGKSSDVMGKSSDVMGKSSDVMGKSSDVMGGK